MTGIILAGGKSTRMGRDKAFININGVSIIDNTINVFRKIFSEIIIVSNTPHKYVYTGIRVVSDLIPGSGALGGLYTGIHKACSKKCFAVACDMPFISEELIRYIISITGYDAVIPRVNGYYEPLFSMYSKACEDIIRKQLEAGNFKINDFYSEVNVREVPEDELRLFDETLASFINVNSAEDLKGITKMEI